MKYGLRIPFEVWAATALVTIVIASCRADGPDDQALTVQFPLDLHDGEPGPEIPSEAFLNRPQVLEPDLELGGFDSGLTWIADLVGLPDGGLIALDRQERTLLRFGSTGQLIDTWGREGEGPGEYKDPVGLERLEEDLVVLDRGLLRLTFLNSSGRVLNTVEIEQPGDLILAMTRSPMLGYHFPYYGHVDFAERLGALSGAAVVYIEDNELHRWLEGTDERNGYLVAFRELGAVVDTIMSFPAAKLTQIRPRAGVPSAQRFHFRGPPIFTQKSIWTSGSAWLATIIPDFQERSLQIRNDGRDAHSEFLLPDPVPITDGDREFAVRWSFRRWSPYWETQRMSRYGRIRPEDRYLERVLDGYQFSATTGAIASMRGASSILWLAPFESQRGPDGISTLWVALDLSTRRLLGSIRFAHDGDRLRDIIACHMFTTNRDRDGLPIIRRYSLPEWGCSAGGFTD